MLASIDKQFLLHCFTLWLNFLISNSSVIQILPENVVSEKKNTHISAFIMLSPESTSLEIAHGEFLFVWILYVPHPIPAFVKTLIPEWPISLFQTLTFQLSHCLRSQGKKSSPPPPLQIMSEPNLFLIPDTTPYHHQHHLCHTLHPRRQHYAVLDVLSLVWECVVPHCCLLMECRQ